MEKHTHLITMARRNTPKVEESTQAEETASPEVKQDVEVNTEAATEAVSVAEPAPEPAPAKVETKEVGTDPVSIELKTPEVSNNLPPAISKEEVAAKVQEKLSRRSDEQGADPFVPSTQLENEVKEVASNKGFPLSRGTEVGARLMARAKRAV